MNTEQMEREGLTNDGLNIIIARELKSLVANNRDNRYMGLIDSIDKCYEYYQYEQDKDLTFDLDFREYLATKGVDSFDNPEELVNDFVEFFKNNFLDGIAVNGCQEDIDTIRYHVSRDTVNCIGFDVNEVRYFLELETLEYISDDGIMYVGRVTIS